MWQGVSVFTRGRRHTKEKHPCQDYGGFVKRFRGIKKEPIFLACVADGASFAKYSHLGAQIAVRTALKNFSSFLKSEEKFTQESFNDQLTSVLYAIQEKQRQIAKKYKAQPDDFSTTFLFICIMPSICFAAQVGDGFILVKQEDEKKYNLVFAPLKGEHINETRFLPLKNFKSVKMFFKKGVVDFCLLATDGIENVAFKMSTWEPSDGFFSPLEKHVRENASQKSLERDLLKFLRGERIQNKNQDDKTLLMGWKR